MTTHPSVTLRSPRVCTPVHTDDHPTASLLEAHARQRHAFPRRSLALPVGLLGLALGLASTGCIIVRDGGGDDGGELPPPGPNPKVFTVGIDEGTRLDADPGRGVGIYVEYEGAGRYRIWTTCDTELSGYACAFDLFAIGAGLQRPLGEDLEGADELVRTGDELYAYLETDYDSDVFSFSIEEGTPMRLEVYLDGYSEPRFVYWVSGGILQRGAPSNPVDFLP